MNKKRAIELLKCLPLRTDISLGEDALEAIRYICAEQEIFNSARVVTYEEWKEVIRKEPLTIKSTKKVEGLTFVELDESSVGTLATSIIDKIMKAKPPALPADVERKMRRIVENYRDDVISTNERAPIKEQKILLDRVATQLLALYPQMASEIEIADKIAQYVFGVKGLCGAGFEDAEITAIQECAHALVGKVAKPQENKRKTPVHLIDGTCKKCGKSLCYCIERLDNGNWVEAKPALTEEELERILPKEMVCPYVHKRKGALCGECRDTNTFNEALSLCKTAILKWQRGER